MKLIQLTEVRYAGSLEAEEVLYALWKQRNEIEKDNLSVVKIHDPALSKKRAAAVARYAIRVIAPEALDVVGMTDEAQKLRDLPTDIDLRYAGRAVRVAETGLDLDDIGAVANSAANAAAKAAAHAAHAANYAADAAAYAANAAYFVSEITNKQRHLYHLDQMIKIAANIK